MLLVATDYCSLQCLVWAMTFAGVAIPCCVLTVFFKFWRTTSKRTNKMANMISDVILFGIGRFVSSCPPIELSTGFLGNYYQIEIELPFRMSLKKKLAIFFIKKPVSLYLS